MDDWDRLDERFRIPPSIFDALPAYRDFGFAVFKLQVTGRESESGLFPEKPATKTFHPMAFEFPRADPDRLFFPTSVSTTASFTRPPSSTTRSTAKSSHRDCRGGKGRWNGWGGEGR